ncbi:Bet1-like protein At4g14600 [Linum perenne]
MASISSRRHGGAAPFRSRQAASSDEIQLRIDPMSSDFDDEISGLRSQVHQLRNVRFTFIIEFYLLPIDSC